MIKEEFDGTLPECINAGRKVVGANYDQNIELNKVNDLTLIVEENNVSKTFLNCIFKAFAPLIIFSILINFVLYFFTRKDLPNYFSNIICFSYFYKRMECIGQFL